MKQARAHLRILLWIFILCDKTRGRQENQRPQTVVIAPLLVHCENIAHAHVSVAPPGSIFVSKTTPAWEKMELWVTEYSFLYPA